MNGKNTTLPSKHCFQATEKRGKRGSKDRVKEDTRQGCLCLPAILQAGFQKPPEAELSPDLSRDRTSITTRWINTRVVKVKWCYVARCYWTRPVKIHDIDTFSRPPRPLLQAETLPRPAEKGQVLEPSPTRQMNHLCSRWIGQQPLSLTQSRRPSDTRGEFPDVPVNVTQQKSCDSYYLASHFNIRAVRYLQITTR